MDANQASDEVFEKFKKGIFSIDEAIGTARQWLIEDMDHFPAYDPARPYEEKNSYIHRANRFGIRLWRQTIPGNQLHPSFADLYYRALVDTILDYENRTGKHFNKGIVYANLGIAQIDQGKFDAGLAHLLTAEWEDREIANPRDFILDSVLWKQYEFKVFAYLMNLNSKPGITFTIDSNFLQNLFQTISREDRIFLQGTLLTLLDNLNQSRVCQNSFTYGRLYSALKDFCLLIESLLRKKQIQNNPIQATHQKTLGILLKKALQSQPIGYPQTKPLLNSSGNNFPEFLTNLEDIQNNALNPQLRWIYTVYLVRNFTGHHFDIQENTPSPSGKTFFADYYVIALDDILSALMYLKQIQAI